VASEQGDVLLTGATGFLGRHTSAALSEAGWRVISGSRRLGSRKEQDVVKCDLDDPASMFSLESQLRPAAIVHLGCHVGWDGSDDERLFTPNVLSTGILVQLARKWGAKLVFSSAAIVHGVRAKRIDKTVPADADTAYARSKLLAEELISAPGIKHTILRFSGIFGSDGPKHLGLNRAIDDALDGVPPTRVGKGSARRNYIYVKDAANAIVSSLGNEIEGVHLVAGTDSNSISEMLDSICDVLLPGTSPSVKIGEEGSDQIVCSSTAIPEGRTFREALSDILNLSRK